MRASSTDLLLCKRLAKGVQYIANDRVHRRAAEIRYRVETVARRDVQGPRRLVEPHDYGVQKGTARLFVYQLRATPDRPGKGAEGWRMLDVPAIERCVVTEQTFKGSRGTPDHDHYKWDVLYARVA